MGKKSGEWNAKYLSITTQGPLSKGKRPRLPIALRSLVDALVEVPRSCALCRAVDSRLRHDSGLPNGLVPSAVLKKAAAYLTIIAVHVPAASDSSDSLGTYCVRLESVGVAMIGC